MAAILAMWRGSFEQTFVPPSQGGSMWNLTLIGPVVSEEKMFQECGDNDGQQTPAYSTSLPMGLWYLSYRWTAKSQTNLCIRAVSPDKVCFNKGNLEKLHIKSHTECLGMPIWAASWQNQQNGMWAQRRLRSAWAFAQSDQSLCCPHKKAWVLSYPLSAQQRLWSDWADAQAADQTGRMPRLIWVFAGCTDHFVGFVMRWLIWGTSNHTELRSHFSWNGSIYHLATDHKAC